MHLLVRSALLLAIGLPAAHACDIAGDIACDSVVVGEADRNTQYYAECNTWTYDGDDSAYTFSAPDGGLVWVRMQGGVWSNDPDLYVTNGACDGDCVAQSVSETASEELVFDAVPGQSYSIQIDDFLDGISGFDYDFQLEVWCAEGACNPAVDVQADLTCSSAQSGSTGPSTGNHLKYYDCPEGSYQGFNPLWQINEEAIYSFVPQASGPVTFRLWNLSNDQDLYVLADSCDPSSCIAASTYASTDEDSVTFDAEAGRTYYIVVEGFEGEGSYDLDFDIGGGGCPEDCTNGLDDDDDGAIDCDDSDCLSECGCDEDGDGYDGLVCGGADCDDADPSVHPGANDVCNLQDDDCDGQIDENAATQTWYLDGDGDTYGGNTSTQACSQPSGYVARDGDCSDSNPAIHPGATDGCDGIDNDCDGALDEDGDAAVWYRDADGDGFGGATTAQQCSAPTGYVGQSGDCNDSSAAVNPGATEVCNGIDDDCDDSIDDADPSLDASTGTAWRVDADGDGHGGPTILRACTQPPNTTATQTDCDDRSAARYPGNVEICDGIDNDCDNRPDEGTSCWDDDGDGATEDGGDCDDASASVRPGLPELCDGIDNDCDGTVDEGTRCFDDDGDGLSEDAGDCNDADAEVHPGASEVEGDGVDNDCDGSVDGGTYDPDGDGVTELGGDCAPEDGLAYPGATERPNGEDDDCDGIVDEGTTLYDDDGDGSSESEGDCDDSDPEVGPHASELANGIDDDCNGLVDDGSSYTDDDGDGLSDDEGDCNDADASVHPGADEQLNGVDDDCDGAIDEDFTDLDGDGVSEEEGDCDDSSGWVRPGIVEVCDGVDNNCDGEIDENCGDAPVVDSTRCGCSSSTTGSLALWPLAGLLLLARRRRGVAAVTALAAVGCDNPDSQFSAIDGRVSVLPGVADLGTVPVGGSADVQLEVMHLSGPQVEVRAVDLFNLDGDWFRVFGDLPTVASGDRGFIDIQYTPEEPGYHRASVTVITSVGDAAEVIVRGRAIDPAGGLFPGVVEFGAVEPGDDSLREIYVVNDSELDWTLDAIELSEPFRVVGSLPISIAAGDTAPLTLGFAPDDAGEAIASAIVRSSGVALPALVLRGNACEGGNPVAYDLDADGVTSCGGDCDDTSAATLPGAPELADGLDNDCDDTIDEGTTAYDDDADGLSEDEGDCNDGDAAIGPHADEDPGNGIDDDCDGTVDLGTDDADGDGVSTGGGDCDDDRASVRPGAPELADGLDNDCDGTIDEGTSRYDDDGDGACEASTCSDGSSGGDCDDSRASIHPGAGETANGRDDDCDGVIDEGTNRYDDDGDSFTEQGGDCDDANPAIHPARVEVSGNGIDDDCDGIAL